MKRVWISTALERLGISAAILAARRHTRSPWLTVLTYHRVTPSGDVGPLDPGVAMPTDEFARQLAMLREAFDIVHLDDVRDAVLRGRALPPAPLLITFDDGYLDNHDVVLPLLRAHGVRATFFVATSYVAERRLFWWDRIHLLVRTCRRDVLALDYPRRSTLLVHDALARARAANELCEAVKTHFDLDLPRFLDHLAARAGVHLDPASERALVDRHVMHWDHVRALHRAGMDVQSHTHTHRVVETLPIDALARELATSRALLEDALGARVDAVSYPVGRAPGYADAVRATLRATGYALAFSNRSGVNPRVSPDALDVKRLSLEGGLPRAHERAVLAIPALAY